MSDAPVSDLMLGEPAMPVEPMSAEGLSLPGEPIGSPDPSMLLGVPPTGPLGGPPIPATLSEVFQQPEVADQPDPSMLLGDPSAMRPSGREKFGAWKFEQVQQANRDSLNVADRTVAVLAQNETIQQQMSATPATSSPWATVSPRAERVAMAANVDELAAALAADTWAGLDEAERLGREAASTIILSRYQQQYGADTPEWDWSVYDTLMSTKVAGGSAATGAAVGLWNRFLNTPERLQDVEVTQLLDNVGRVATIVDDMERLAGTLNPDTDIEQVSFGDDGPMVFTKAPIDFTGSMDVAPVSPSLLTVEAPPGRNTVFMGDGRVGLIAHPTERNAAAWNGYAPVLVGANDEAARWLPAGPVEVASLDRVRMSVWTQEQLWTESFLNTDLQSTGGRHPVFTGQRVVVYTVPPGFSEIRGFGWSPIPIGRTRIETPPTQDRPFGDAEGGRRFYVNVPADTDLAGFGNEIEARGGKNVLVYGPVADLPGWERHRQHFWSDGIETFTTISDRQQFDDANAVTVFTRPMGRQLSTEPVAGQKMRLDDRGLVTYGDVVRVQTSAGQVEPSERLLDMKIDGRRVRRYGFVFETNTFVPITDDATAAQFPVKVVRRSGGHDVVVDDPAAFDAGVTAGLLIKAAGGSPQRLVAPGVRTSFH